MPATERLKAALSDRYHIEREIGAGGMATVYLARDLKHDREVALKVLRADLSAVIGTERFLSEVRISARLDHPHILTLIDSGEADGILYYVLPFVRGESLRQKLERERQLGVEESLSIARQVASALDYAHQKGVVHRDIKPENILLHEGEAVLADFGIALAVKEAGGNRLTETGLSLGTPQYMSPEQATGDRALDKRSDIYSLGAVFYEMITGEPPVTGATAQAMIAKLLTERPVKLRVVRPTISTEMERATDKALSKVPADRFTSAGEFVSALSVVAPERAVRPPLRRNALIAAGVVAAAASGFVLYMAGHGSGGVSERQVTLRDRVQVTSTGNVSIPTVSDDGKILAYAVSDCGSSGCRYAVEVRDLADGATRRLVSGSTAIYALEVSPDRRNLLVLGSINGSFGSFIVSLVGGAPRYLSTFAARFFANGDSLVLGRSASRTPFTWMLTSGTDGVPVDSVRVEGGSDKAAFYYGIPNSRRFVRQSMKDEIVRFDVIDRAGKISSSIALPRGVDGGASTSADALWIFEILNATSVRNIIRVPLDATTGKLAQRGDTVYTGRSSSMSVTGDGGSLVYDEGTTSLSAWALPFADIVSNKFTADKHLVTATGGLRGSISPDGAISVVGREMPQGNYAFSVVPFGDATEIPVPGLHKGAAPLDSTTLKMIDINDSSTVLSLFDYRTKKSSATRVVNALGLLDVSRAADAWVWIPADGRSINVQRDSDRMPRSVPLPKWYRSVFWTTGSPDGKIAFAGWHAPDEDSLGVGMFSMADNKFTHLYATFAEFGAVYWLEDGSLLAAMNDTPESETFYRIREGDAPRRLGSTPRLISSITTVSMSGDLKRAFIVTRDDRRDVWVSKVTR